MSNTSQLQNLLRSEVYGDLSRVYKVYDSNGRLTNEYKNYANCIAESNCLLRVYRYEDPNNAALITGQNTSIATWTQTIHDKTTVDPYNIELSNLNIVQTSSVNTVVGTLSSSGGVSPVTYTLINDGGGSFKIENGNEVQVASALDVNDSPVIISVKLTDAVGNEFTKNFSIVIESYENQKSLFFNGVNEDLNGGNIHNYDIATAFSVSMWIKPQNLSSARILFAKAGDAPDVKGYMVRHNAGGKILIQLRGGLNRAYTFNTTLTSGVWQNLIFTYNGSSDISGASVYLNGIKEASGTSGSLGSSWLVNQDFTIGSRNDSAYYSGHIDEVTVWNKELSQSDVDEIYNSGVPANPEEHASAPFLVSYYTMGDSDTLPTIQDNKGNFDLTAQNMDSSNITTDIP